jgi:hypothetical protein
MKDLAKTSQEIVDGTYKPQPDKQELAKFNEYFYDRKYDAFSVDRCTGGNLLYFTLVYSFMKFGWHSSIPTIDE